ncbi:MAG: polyprenol phosphomannose-dependent alpha 1,6 mannosyltransferase MptB [Candidatus Phosphoribacter sp.]|nr:polyprenol phosphomannose-dependent alpha 1,6 mannosyltransferase MptB [Actinomycetales bacterium]
MTSPSAPDRAHRVPTGWGGRVRRELADIGYAWSDGVTRWGTLGSVLIMIGAYGPSTMPNANIWRDLPVIGLAQTTLPGRILATGCMLIGVLILLDAWLRLRPASYHRLVTRGTVWLWSLPLLLAPPLLSFDAFSYAAQGELVARGLDPYEVGPGVLGDAFTSQVDQMWRDTPAPYGPLSLQLQHLIVVLTGHQPYLSALLVRIPAFVGVLLLAIYLPRLARRIGYDRETTIWLAVLNPLVLLHLVGGAHNDALMIGLMVWGLWVAAKIHWAPAAVIVAAAASIKQPAAAAVLAVAALHAWRVGLWRERPSNAAVARYAVGVVGVFSATFAAIGVATGLGFGWITALGVPNAVRSFLSPVTTLASGLDWVLVRLGIVPDADIVVPIAQRVGQVSGLLIVTWLVLRFKAKHPVRTLGWLLLVFVFTGPVVHPWYILWGGLFFAMTESGPLARRIVVWATCGLAMYSVVDASWRSSAIAVGVTAAIALVWITTGHDRDLIRDRDLARGRDSAAGTTGGEPADAG